MRKLAKQRRNRGLPGGSVVKNLPFNSGDAGSIPGPGRSYREENVNPLQYSCLENPMDEGAWQATVNEVAKSQTQLSDPTAAAVGEETDCAPRSL